MPVWSEPTLRPPPPCSTRRWPFAEQVNEQNPRVRKQLLDRAQQIIDERVVFIPVMGSVFINGVESRPEVHGLGLLAARLLRGRRGRSPRPCSAGRVARGSRRGAA